MICDILSTIEKYNMLENVRTVAVGVSGGADSVCLLHFLSKIREKYDIVLHAIHVNHNIRGEEAKRDEAFVVEFCNSLDVKCDVFSINVPDLAKKLSICEEECGRKVRYDCFNKVDADVIAVAHTLSDSVETIIFNLTRGTGLKGICGIPPVRDNIIRPLIELTREDVEEYCRQNNLSYVTDSTNLEDEYTRNKIRHGVIPVLKSINPNFEKSVLRFENSVCNDNLFIESEAAKLLNISKTQDGYFLEYFKKSHQAVIKRAVSLIISDKLKKPVESRHIELCYNAIMASKGKIELSKDLYILIDGDIISFHTNTKSNVKPWHAQCVEGIFTTPYGKYAIELCEVSNIVSADYDNAVAAETVSGTLILRSRQAGDCFTDYKRRNTKTIKKIFNEKKMALDERIKTAVLCSDENVLWVYGLGTNAKHRINNKTEYAYIIKRGEF